MESNLYRVTFDGTGLWTYRTEGKAFDIAPPVFCLDGEEVVAAVHEVRSLGSELLANGVTEHRWEGVVKDHPDLALEMRFRIAPDNSVVRFCYVLKSATEHRLTNREGRNMLRYLAWSAADLPQATEVRLSTFVETVHSFCLEEVALPTSHFDNRLTCMGPILTATDGNIAQLAAY